MNDSSATTAPHAATRLGAAKRWAVAATAVTVAVGLAGCGTPTASPSAPASAAHSTPPGSHPGTGGGSGGSNARSGPAEGGSVGSVGSTSSSGFTLSTPAGQKVTVKDTPSTTYERNGASASSGDVTVGEVVEVLGTVDSTTISAGHVIVESPSALNGTGPAKVVAFQQGSKAVDKKVGQIPSNYTEGSGTIQSGATADAAARAALTAYPGGVVDRVVQLSTGEYEVHTIGVAWPHHVFVDQQDQAVGAY